MVAKIRPVRVTRGNVDVGCDLCVDFLKLASSRDFETSSSAVRKLFLVFMCRHGGHVGVQNILYYYAKLERRLAIVLCTNMAVSSRE